MDQEIDLITQSSLEDTNDTPSTLMELNNDPRKREPTASKDTNELPNVIPTRKLQQ